MKAKCDECSLEFNVEFKRRKFGRNFEETYFRCENCFVHTTCYITNGKVRKLQKEIREEKNPERREELLDNISEIMDELLIKYGRR